MDRGGMSRGSRGGFRGRGGPRAGGFGGRGGPGMRGRGGGPPRGGPRGGPYGGRGGPRGGRGGPPERGGRHLDRDEPMGRSMSERSGAMGHVAPPYHGGSSERGGPLSRSGAPDMSGPMGRNGPPERGAPIRHGGPPERRDSFGRGGTPGRGLPRGTSRGRVPSGRGSPIERGFGRGTSMERGGGLGSSRDSCGGDAPPYSRMPSGGMGPSAKRGRYDSSYSSDSYRHSPEYSGYGGSGMSDYSQSDGYQQSSGGYVTSTYMPDDNYGRSDVPTGGYGNSASGPNYQTYQDNYPSSEDYRNGSSMNEGRGDYRGQSYSTSTNTGYSSTYSTDRGGYGHNASEPYGTSSYDAYDSYSSAPSSGGYASKEYTGQGGTRGSNDDQYGYETYGGTASYQSRDNYGGSVSSYGPPSRGGPPSRRY